MSTPLGMGAPLPIPDLLTVYGASWCSDCRRTKRYLEALGVRHRYVDLEMDAGAQAMLDAAGYRAIPVVVTPAGTILVEPTDLELARTLETDAA